MRVPRNSKKVGNNALHGYKEAIRKNKVMKDDTTITNSSRRALQALFRYFRKSNRGVASTCRSLALYLNQQIDPQQNWQWQYVHQILHGKLKASSNLAGAIAELYKKIFEAPEPELQIVSVFAPIGFIPDQTIVLRRARRCALKTCNRFFVPKNRRQKFHSPFCRKQYRSGRRKRMH